MKKVIVFGAGGYLRKHMSIIQRFAEIAYICDNDKKKQGMIINGIECIAPSRLPDYQDLEIIITVEDIKAREMIQEQLRRQGQKGIMLWELLAERIEIDSPVEVFAEETHIYMGGSRRMPVFRLDFNKLLQKCNCRWVCYPIYQKYQVRK